VSRQIQLPARRKCSTLPFLYERYGIDDGARVERPYNSWVFVVILTAAVLAIVLLFLLRKRLLDWIGLPGVNTAEYFSTIFAIVGGLILLLLGFSFWPDFDRIRTAMLVEVSGACVGWVLGMFFSPTSPNEQQTFVNAKTALVGIVSGYILSKLQSLFREDAGQTK
jgi:small basic protein